MVAAWQVLGTAGLLARLRRLNWRETLWATLALVGTLLLGAVLIWLVDRWRRRSAESPSSANDQLAHFRELHARGELSKEEFEQVRGLLDKRLRPELDVPPPQDNRPSEPPGAGPPPNGTT